MDVGTACDACVPGAAGADGGRRAPGLSKLHGCISGKNKFNHDFILCMQSEKNISNTCVKVISTFTFVVIVSHVDLENNLETN